MTPVVPGRQTLLYLLISGSRQNGEIQNTGVLDAFCHFQQSYLYKTNKRRLELWNLEEETKGLGLVKEVLS